MAAKMLTNLKKIKNFSSKFLKNNAKNTLLKKRIQKEYYITYY
jgi:hypothetical protein